MEFKLPPSYDDLFSKGDKICLDNNPNDKANVTGVGEEQGDSQPLYPVSEDNQEKGLVNSQYREESSKPDKTPQIKKMLHQQQLTPAEPIKTALERNQNKKGLKTPTLTTTQKTNRNTTDMSKLQAKPNNTVKVESSSATPSSQPPTAAKRNSKVINKPNNVATKPVSNIVKPNQIKNNLADKPGSTATENIQNTAQSPPVAPVKKTYKKMKKTVPTEVSVKSD